MSHDSHGHGDAHGEGHGHYLIPYPIYYKVFGGLIFLTVLTVVTAKYVDLGWFNLPLALIIASTKAGLVVAFFMALKYDSRVNALILGLGCVFVVIFLTITLLDTNFVFLLVLVPVVLSMLAWTVWSVYKICQPEVNDIDEWELLHLESMNEPELEASIVGVRQIQKRRRDGAKSLGDDYSYMLGQSMGYGIPVSWIQDLGERRN